MRRRTILGILSLTLLLGSLALGQEARPDRQIAITFDDLPFGGLRRTADAYLRFTAAQLDFWEGVAQTVVGRPLRHVLLLHDNEINAGHLGELLALLRRRGYRFVPLEEALRDEAYRLPDAYAGRAGVSWLYRWAVSRGIQIDWQHEPEPPAEIQTLYSRLTS